MPYVVRFKAREARSSKDTGQVLMTAEGEEHWVVTEPEGWVDATSSTVGADRNRAPLNAKRFDDWPEANEFMRKWKGHPWYAVPRSWETLPVTVVYKQVEDFLLVDGS